MIKQNVPLKAIVLWLFFLFLSMNQLTAQSARAVWNLNSDWAFYRGDIANGQSLSCDDSKWIPTVVPHIMQLETKHCGGDAIYDGIGWYRRYFKLEEGMNGKRIALSFQGVMTSCEVFLNGMKVAENHGGYMGFIVDITDKVKFDSNNVLAVRVNAKADPLTPPGKPQGALDFNYYSGIYRDVEMIITDKLFITDALEEDEIAGGGVFVTFPQVSKSKAKVEVKTEVKNVYQALKEGKLVTSIIDKKGKIVAKKSVDFSLTSQSKKQMEQTLEVASPKLWHPYEPNLYTLRSEVVVNGVVVDSHDTEIGIRTIKFTTEQGFFINGEWLYLRGCNRHQAFANVGDAASNSMQERDVIDMKRGGYNAVRAAHYPNDPEFLSACNKHGLLVVECIPGWQFYNNDSTFINRAFEVGRRMIRRDRNHPSVILWETALNESRYPYEFAKAVYDLSHEEYPGDQMYTAGDFFGHEQLKDCYDVFYKQVSKFPKDGDVMSNYLEDQIAVKPLFTREWGDGVGEKPRVSLTENEVEQVRQCWSHAHQLNGNGYFDWCMLDANPRMGGHFVWSYNDYARGCCDETLYCGKVDINRYPKFSYFYLQSMRDRNISQKGLYEGPMVYVASYNASPEFISSTSKITVFSNCDEVRLYRNGKLLGTQTRKQQTEFYKPIVEKGGSPCFIFDAGGYEAGELKADALIKGKVVATHSVRTPEAAAQVVVMIHDAGVRPVADGSDMIPVYFKICDSNGQLVYNSNEAIEITVKGEGVLMGDGIERIGVNPQKVEGGVGFAFVRTTKKAGTIEVIATAKGMRIGKATITTEPYTGTYVPNGTHKVFTGKEEDNVLIKPTKQEKELLSKPKLKVEKVTVEGSQSGYPESNIIDGNDRSWWIASSDKLPQVVTVELAEITEVSAIRVLFMKDSSTYQHTIEYSSDGEKWTAYAKRSCTGWDFKPQPVYKSFKYLRITFENVSEGRAGLGEITLFGK